MMLVVRALKINQLADVCLFRYTHIRRRLPISSDDCVPAAFGQSSGPKRRKDLHLASRPGRANKRVLARYWRWVKRATIDGRHSSPPDLLNPVVLHTMPPKVAAFLLYEPPERPPWRRQETLSECADRRRTSTARRRIRRRLWRRGRRREILASRAASIPLAPQSGSRAGQYCGNDQCHQAKPAFSCRID